MKILIFVVVILSILMVSKESPANEGEFRLNFGLYTKHYMNYSDDLNENNNLIQLTYAKNGNLITAAKFDNSHNVESYLLGAGYEFKASEDFTYGGYIAAIKGYEGYIRTHYKGIIFGPVAFAAYRGLKVNVLPTVYSLGYEFKF